MLVDQNKTSTGGNQMCQYNNTIKEKKFKQINYNERTQIERWYNIEQKSKSEIGRLLGRPEGSIRREIKRGLVDNLTTDLKVIKVYSADVAQQKCDYNKTGKGPQLKLGKDFGLKSYIENGIKKERKSPEILLAEIKNKGHHTIREKSQREYLCFMLIHIVLANVEVMRITID